MAFVSNQSPDSLWKIRRLPCHRHTTTRTQTGPDPDYPTATVSLLDVAINRVPDDLASQIASSITLDQYNWNQERFDNGTTDPSGPQSCPNTETPGGLSDKKSCNKCEKSPASFYDYTTVDNTTARDSISTFCNGFSLCDGLGCQASRTIQLTDTNYLVFGLSRTGLEGCKKPSGPIPAEYCIKALEGISSDCDDDSSETYGGSFTDNSEYGCLHWAFTVAKAKPDFYSGKSLSSNNSD